MIHSIPLFQSGLTFPMTYSKLELNGKTAVVVGGTSGIGRAIALGFAEAGADVVPTSRRAEQVETTAREIEELGRRSLRITSDVSNRDSLAHVLSETIGAFGKVDILVNSGGPRSARPRSPSWKTTGITLSIQI